MCYAIIIVGDPPCCNMGNKEDILIWKEKPYRDKPWVTFYLVLCRAQSVGQLLHRCFKDDEESTFYQLSKQDIFRFFQLSHYSEYHPEISVFEKMSLQHPESWPFTYWCTELKECGRGSYQAWEIIWRQ